MSFFFYFSTKTNLITTLRLPTTSYDFRLSQLPTFPTSDLRLTTFPTYDLRLSQLTTSDFRLPTSDFRLPQLPTYNFPNFRLPTYDLRLPRLPTYNFRLTTSNFRLTTFPTSDLQLTRLTTYDLRLTTKTSSIPPQFKNPNTYSATSLPIQLLTKELSLPAEQLFAQPCKRHFPLLISSKRVGAYNLLLMNWLLAFA